MQFDNNDKKMPWILCGYRLFAFEGPNGLKIETLSKLTGINKSSFYHHFADIEIFTEHLLNFHLQNIEQLVNEEKYCKSIIPDWIEMLLNYKVELLFNRQLRVNRDNQIFKKCFEKATIMSEYEIRHLWNNFIAVNSNSELSKNLFFLAIESFFFQISKSTLNYEWMENYFLLIQKTVNQMKYT